MLIFKTLRDMCYIFRQFKGQGGGSEMGWVVGCLQAVRQAIQAWQLSICGGM